ncbi:MAG: HAMP domain-containing sensor histidine kinase [Sphingomonadales bacterium]|jgi:two-component system sensor histidine kinase ChvG
MRAFALHAPRSLTVRLLVFFAIFLLLPILLYVAFRVSDNQRNELILRAVNQEGQTISQALRAPLENFSASASVDLAQVLAPFAGPDRRLKLFYRPSNGPGGFFYMAALPVLDPDTAEAERSTLETAGIFQGLAEQCAEGQSLAKRFTNPAGREELVTSVTPLSLANGCWAIIVSHQGEIYLTSTLGKSFWSLAPVRIALVSYAFVALIAAWLLFDVRFDMKRIAEAARDIRIGRKRGEDFKSRIRMPELAEMASELDRLVHTLDRSRNMIRQAAEENAHAFKTPLAVIQQALEPLRRTDPNLIGSDGTRSIEVIGQAMERLDALVTAARTLDAVAADSLEVQGERLDLSAFLTHMAASFEPVAAVGKVQVVCDVEAGLHCEASAEPLETVIENLLENALSFSPPGGRIFVKAFSKEKDRIKVLVEDEGPGVADEELEKIFSRYYSARSLDESAKDNDNAHFGLGLWIVRRNIEALGGEVHAENRKVGGFKISITLPKV